MTTPGARPPRRKAEISALRRLSRNVLVIGTVVALLAAFGPVWVARVGVVVAVSAAVLACVLAWREVAEERRRHAAETLAASRAHGHALTEERRHNASVVDAISGRLTTATTELHSSQARVVDLTASVVGLTGTIAGLRSQIAAVQDRYAGSQREVRERDSVIATLRETVRSREAELLALSEASGQVRSIPRRVLAEHESAGERLAVAADLSPDHRQPDVVDLVDVAVVLPNYEGERKLA